MEPEILSESMARFGSLGHRPSLGPMRDLLQKLGNPQHRLPPVIHIGGTNGKGSVSAFLKSCLQAAGLRVHRFTSPHLKCYTERIEVAGIPISSEALCSYLDQCAVFLDAIPISIFEALTASAFLAFLDTPGDIILLEVGVGGTWDATNVVETTCVSVLTPISEDHLEMLGPTLLEVARCKSGIMRSGIPCVLAPQREEVTKLLRILAEPMGTPLFSYGKEWYARPLNPGLEFFWMPSGQWDLSVVYSSLGLVGCHQAINAATALAVLKVQSHFSISQTCLMDGLRMAHWPGRLEHLREGGVVKAFPDSWEIWVDGAHNPAGAEVLRTHILQNWSDRPLILVLSILQSKDGYAMWKILAPVAHQIYILEEGGSSKFTKGDVFRQYAKETGHGVEICVTVQEFLNRVPSILAEYPLHQPGRILFCGSLYGVAPIRSFREE